MLDLIKLIIFTNGASFSKSSHSVCKLLHLPNGTTLYQNDPFSPMVRRFHERKRNNPKHWGARQFDFQILADGKSTIFTNGAQVSLKNNNS